jgi:hypothetical protein
MDELIKMLSKNEHELKEPVMNDEEKINWYNDVAFNCGVNSSKQLIKDYYENK